MIVVSRVSSGPPALTWISGGTCKRLHWERNLAAASAMATGGPLLTSSHRESITWKDHLHDIKLPLPKHPLPGFTRTVCCGCRWSSKRESR